MLCTSRKLKIFNTNIDNLSMLEFLQELKSGIVFTPNVNHIVRLQKDRELQNAYNAADYVVCDSTIVLHASHFLGKPIQEKISGSDILPAFYTCHRKNPTIKIFLLGADEGVALRAQNCINQKVGRRIVVGAHSPSFGFEKDEAECLKIIDLINHTDATVLVVGVGCPKQEKWILKYRDRLPTVKILMALGAAIDFEAGHKSRAPKWIGDVGLEWLYRLVSEPRRLWKRYLLDVMPFFWLVVKEKLSDKAILD
jgi:N-acetylglucosaminyldiphosphoundecaprenol N-acetyl-beta-D-mannosaminyltransferase